MEKRWAFGIQRRHAGRNRKAMSILRISVAGAVAAVLATAWSLPHALAQATSGANCDWYARTALKQQQENEQRGCGLKGPEWNWDLSAHTNWCRGVPPDLWKKQAQLREQQLSSCAKKS